MAKPRKHSEEFKREAVRMMMSRGERTVEDVARSLGIATSLLGKWHTKYASYVKAVPRAGKETAEQHELRELRKKVRELEMERDILKNRQRLPWPYLLGEKLVLGYVRAA